MSKKVKLLLGILLIVSIVCVATRVFAASSDLNDLLNGLDNNDTSTSTNDNDTNSDTETLPTPTKTDTNSDTETLPTPTKTDTNNDTEVLPTPGKTNTTNNAVNNTVNTSTYNNNIAYAGPSEVAFGLLIAVSAFTVIGVVAFKKVSDYKNI